MIKEKSVFQKQTSFGCINYKILIKRIWCIQQLQKIYLDACMYYNSQQLGLQPFRTAQLAILHHGKQSEIVISKNFNNYQYQNKFGGDSNLRAFLSNVWFSYLGDTLMNRDYSKLIQFLSVVILRDRMLRLCYQKMDHLCCQQSLLTHHDAQQKKSERLPCSDWHQ